VYIVRYSASNFSWKQTTSLVTPICCATSCLTLTKCCTNNCSPLCPLDSGTLRFRRRLGHFRPEWSGATLAPLPRLPPWSFHREELGALRRGGPRRRRRLTRAGGTSQTLPAVKWGERPAGRGADAIARASIQSAGQTHGTPPAMPFVPCAAACASAAESGGSAGGAAAGARGGGGSAEPAAASFAAPRGRRPRSSLLVRSSPIFPLLAHKLDDGCGCGCGCCGGAASPPALPLAARGAGGGRRKRREYASATHARSSRCGVCVMLSSP
jgi:hypothetical protein